MFYTSSGSFRASVINSKKKFEEFISMDIGTFGINIIPQKLADREL